MYAEEGGDFAQLKEVDACMQVRSKRFRSLDLDGGYHHVPGVAIYPCIMRSHPECRGVSASVDCAIMVT